jgi:hypothetical protein
MDGKMATTETPNLEHNTVVLQLEQYFTHSVEQEYGQMDFSQLPKVIAELRQWQTFKTMDGQVMQRDVLGWMAGILAVVILLGGIGLSIFIFSAIFYKIINLFSMPAAFVQLKGLGAITLGAIIGMTGMMHFMICLSAGITGLLIIFPGLKRPCSLSAPWLVMSIRKKLSIR